MHASLHPSLNARAQGHTLFPPSPPSTHARADDFALTNGCATPLTCGWPSCWLQDRALLTALCRHPAPGQDPCGLSPGRRRASRRCPDAAGSAPDGFPALASKPWIRAPDPRWLSAPAQLKQDQPCVPSCPARPSQSGELISGRSCRPPENSSQPLSQARNPNPLHFRFQVQNARKLLGRFGLEPHAHTISISALSGGQKARVAFAGTGNPPCTGSTTLRTGNAPARPPFLRRGCFLAPAP